MKLISDLKQTFLWSHKMRQTGIFYGVTLAFRSHDIIAVRVSGCWPPEQILPVEVISFFSYPGREFVTKQDEWLFDVQIFRFLLVICINWHPEPNNSPPIQLHSCLRELDECLLTSTGWKCNFMSGTNHKQRWCSQFYQLLNVFKVPSV